ncbi:MAG: hypothetical protein AB7N24_23930 [Dehalococcoidia bacterium]
MTAVGQGQRRTAVPSRMSLVWAMARDLVWSGVLFVPFAFGAVLLDGTPGVGQYVLGLFLAPYLGLLYVVSEIRGPGAWWRGIEDHPDGEDTSTGVRILILLLWMAPYMALQFCMWWVTYDAIRGLLARA